MADKKSIGTVTGVVQFYGKVDNYQGDGKEYCLCIENPVFSVDESVIKEIYPKKVPNIFKSVMAGENIERAYFNSAYPITKVSVADQKKTIEVKNPELKGMKVNMILNKTYIGPVLCETTPEEFKPSGFSMDSFGSLDFD